MTTSQRSLTQTLQPIPDSPVKEHASPRTARNASRACLLEAYSPQAKP
jgi:hypothetical protein